MKLSVAILILAAAVFVSPAFFEPLGIMSDDAYRNADWLSIRLFDAHAFESIHLNRQWPLWCPYVGGGYPTWQHPSDGSFTPWILTILAFGPVVGVKFNLILFVFFGGLGVFFLCADILRYGRAASLFAALGFITAGWLPSMMLVGFYNQYTYMLVPMTLYFLIRSFTNARFVIPTAALFALYITQGVSGVYALAIVCGLMTLLHVVQFENRRPRFHWKPGVVFAVALALASSMAAVKIAGVRDLVSRGYYAHGMSDAQTIYEHIDEGDFFYTSPLHFIRSAAGHVPKKAAYNEHGRPLDDEYAWLGAPWIALVLFIFGAWIARRRLWPFLVVGAIVLLLCFGPYLGLDLYRVLIWPFKTLRRISQFYKYFNFYILFVIILASGGAVAWLANRFQGKKAKMAVGLCFAALLPQAAMHASLFHELFKNPMPIIERSPVFYQVESVRDRADEDDSTLYREGARPGKLVEYYNFARNVGTVDWYADIYLPENSLPKHFVTKANDVVENTWYKGEVWSDSKGIAIEDYSFTANTQRAAINATSLGVIVFNQNYDPDWKSEQGLVHDHDGLLSVQIDKPGRREILLNYRPRKFYTSLMISVLAIFLSGLLWIRFNKESG
jgi:hypothetical protein